MARPGRNEPEARYYPAFIGGVGPGQGKAFGPDSSRQGVPASRIHPFGRERSVELTRFGSEEEPVLDELLQEAKAVCKETGAGYVVIYGPRIHAVPPEGTRLYVARVQLYVSQDGSEDPTC